MDSTSANGYVGCRCWCAVSCCGSMFWTSWDHTAPQNHGELAQEPLRMSRLLASSHVFSRLRLPCAHMSDCAHITNGGRDVCTPDHSAVAMASNPLGFALAVGCAHKGGYSPRKCVMSEPWSWCSLERICSWALKGSSTWTGQTSVSSVVRPVPHTSPARTRQQLRHRGGCSHTLPRPIKSSHAPLRGCLPRDLSPPSRLVGAYAHMVVLRRATEATDPQTTGPHTRQYSRHPFKLPPFARVAFFLTLLFIPSRFSVVGPHPV